MKPVAVEFVFMKTQEDMMGFYTMKKTILTS